MFKIYFFKIRNSRLNEVIAKHLPNRFHEIKQVYVVSFLKQAHFIGGVTSCCFLILEKIGNKSLVEFFV